MKRINKRPNDWTDTEDCELRRLYLNLNMTAQEVANQLGRSKQSVYVRISRLGFGTKKDTRKCVLTNSDKLWLKLNYPYMANKICAMKFGISERTLHRLIQPMGLKKSEQFIKECWEHSFKLAREASIRLGIVPKKGVVNDNLKHGEKYRWKRKYPDEFYLNILHDWETALQENPKVKREQLKRHLMQKYNLSHRTSIFWYLKTARKILEETG